MDSGDRVGYLVLQRSFLKQSATGKLWKYWVCECDCGNIVDRVASYLYKKGTRPSCGCRNRVREETRGRNQRWKGAGEIPGSYLAMIRCSARARKLEFGITAEECWAKYREQRGRCSLSGLRLKFGNLAVRHQGSEQTASLDRIDSREGYHSDNIQWLHKAVNLIKNHFDDDVVIGIAKLVASLHPRPPRDDFEPSYPITSRENAT